MTKYLSIIGLFLIIGCSTANKIPKKETLKIEDAYQKISFTPELITNEISGGFEMSIQPIDAKAMNKITYASTNFDGDYEKIQSISTIIEEQLRQTNLSKEERRRIELRKQIVDYVKSKTTKGEIPKTEGEYLIWKLWNKRKGVDGTETERSIGRGFSSNYNPYKVNRKYLSVFQLTFKNSTNSVKRIKLNELLFNSGYEQLYPFETSYFENLYANDQEKLRIIYRLNMPSELVIPSGETVIKYVSIPSINPTIKELDVKLIEKDKTKNFAFTVKIEQQTQSSLLEKFVFKAENEFKLQTKRYYLILVTSDNQIHIIKDNSLFLPDEIKNDNLSLYGIATLSSGYTFAKKENFKLSQFPNNLIELNFEDKESYKK